MNLYIGVESVKSGKSTLHQVALWDEYGTELIPPRPAFRMGGERAVKKNSKLIQGYMNNMLRAAFHGKNARQISNRRENVLLTQIGRSAVKEVMGIIKNKETVSNAPATIRKKGFDWPLRDKGILENNIAYLVEDK